MRTENANPLLCDPVSGTCELPNFVETAQEQVLSSGSKPVKISYFTDPICSTCWGIEPQLRKLKLQYGDVIEIDYHMGGLLPNWSYNSGGISKPSDVAHHWEEVSAYYEMPIEGGVWLEDPLHSSYPPSIAIKAAQLQSKEKALIYMRKLRELVFLDKKNIAKWEVLEKAAEDVGLAVLQLKEDYEHAGLAAFEEDLELAQKMKVRGFPTFFFSDQQNKQTMLYGFKPYSAFEEAVLQCYPASKSKPIASKGPLDIFEIYPTLSPKEYSVLLDLNDQETNEILTKLVQDGKIEKQMLSTGSMYHLRK